MKSIIKQLKVTQKIFLFFIYCWEIIKLILTLMSVVVLGCVASLRKVDSFEKGYLCQPPLPVTLGQSCRLSADLAGFPPA